MATVVLDDVVRTKAQDEQAQPAPRLVPSISLAPPHAGPLAEVVAATGTSVVLRPCAFFVAWSGVLTLAYTGFPEAMRVLKQGINNSLTALSKEAPGSRWPKTSLGCLKDGKRLTPEQLETLRDICTQESGAFQQPQSRRSQAVLVDQLELIVYECRCLERKISKHVMPLRPHIDSSEPSQDEKARVQELLAEMDQEDYWYHASRDGNREIHYRGTALGVTLVHELAAFTGRVQATGSAPVSRTHSGGAIVISAVGSNGTQPLQRPATDTGDLKPYSCALAQLIRTFRERVDRELPGLYSWFDDASLHVTIRAII